MIALKALRWTGSLDSRPLPPRNYPMLSKSWIPSTSSSSPADALDDTRRRIQQETMGEPTARCIWRGGRYMGTDLFTTTQQRE